MKNLILNDNHIKVIQDCLNGYINETTPPEPKLISAYDEVMEMAFARAEEYGEDYMLNNELYNTDTIKWLWQEYIRQEGGEELFKGMLMADK